MAVDRDRAHRPVPDFNRSNFKLTPYRFMPAQHAESHMNLTTPLRRPAIALLLACGGCFSAQSSTSAVQSVAWTDPSPHRARLVAVAPGVSLELLDWGGTGEPLVFLAGSGHSAHIYDSFATRFIPRFRVLGVTRRGVGASSRPTTGYDTVSLASDIMAVLDSLGLQKASFAAHSFGGSEINYIAAHYPKRVDRLVYLDAAFDYRAVLDSPELTSGRIGTPYPPEPTYGYGTVRTWTLYGERVSGPGFPESEVRAMFAFDSAGGFLRSASADSLLLRYDRGVAQVDLRQVRVPTLAIYAQLPSAEAMFPYWATLDAAARAQAERSFEAVTALHGRLRPQFQEAVPHARVVLIPGARHYVFLTDPAEVEHAMLEFLLAPPAGP